MIGENCQELLPLSSKRLFADDPTWYSSELFHESIVWRTTNSVCSCLFRTLGRYYDELWFPTVVNELCMLYYRCNYANNYWEKIDEFLDGDEEVRDIIWSEILRHRRRFDKRREVAMRDVKNICIPKAPVLNLMNMYGVTDQADLAKILEMHGALNLAKDQIDLKVASIENVDCTDPEEAEAARKKAEIEAAEKALADPDDDPNWVQMRRRMRGSFSGLKLSKTDTNREILDHIMVELCKYWGSLPKIDYEIEPLLARNILREIQNFRFKLFDVAVEIEPERVQSCSLPLEAPVVTTPVTRAKPVAKKPTRTRAACSRNRGPAPNKLSEARARMNAARIQNQNCA